MPVGSAAPGAPHPKVEASGCEDAEAEPERLFRLLPCRIDSLPALAWLAAADLESGEVRLFHGRFVEVTERFFVEGGWSGRFEEGEIAAAATVFGSGGALTNGAVTFVSSVATTDYLYHRRRDRTIVVSNSLPFLLAQDGDRLDATCRDYATINASIVDGVVDYLGDIPTEKGSVKRLMFRNLEITKDGTREIDKPSPPRFETYEDYVRYLRAQYQGLVGNLRAGRRRHGALRVYSTQSKGYDSTAINALAAPYGIDAAFTVTTGKAKGKFATDDKHRQVDDDGTEICRVLGIACIPIDRRAFEEERSDEYLYHASLDNNGDMNLAEVTDRAVAPAVLLTGCLGEMWYTRTESRIPDVAPTLKRWDLGNHGLTEVRLKAGIVQVAPVYIGATHRADIVRITESAEMTPWRLGVAYDRPIPRRIAESAGVPRAMFGQNKMASVVEFPAPRVPFSRVLRRRYFDFLVRHGLRSRLQTTLFPAVHRINAHLHFVSAHQHRATYYLQRLVSKAIGRRWSLEQLWRDLDGSVFCFAVNLRIADYADALGGSARAHHESTAAIERQ